MVIITVLGIDGSLPHSLMTLLPTEPEQGHWPESPINRHHVLVDNLIVRSPNIAGIRALDI